MAAELGKRLLGEVEEVGFGEVSDVGRNESMLNAIG